MTRTRKCSVCKKRLIHNYSNSYVSEFSKFVKDMWEEHRVYICGVCKNKIIIKEYNKLIDEKNTN